MLPASAAAPDAVPAAPDFGFVKCLAIQRRAAFLSMAVLPVCQIPFIGIVARETPQPLPNSFEVQADDRVI